MDNTLKEIIKETSTKLNLPEKQIELLIKSQHKDILEVLKGKGKVIKFIFLKYFGSFVVKSDLRRPYK